jgi:hypothetical protein
VWRTWGRSTVAAHKKLGAPFHRLVSKLNVASVRDEKYNACNVEWVCSSLSGLLVVVVAVVVEEEEEAAEEEEEEDAWDERRRSPSAGTNGMLSPQATQSDGQTMLWLYKESYKRGEFFFQQLYDSSLWAEPETFRFMGEAEAAAEAEIIKNICAGG